MHDDVGKPLVGFISYALGGPGQHAIKYTNAFGVFAARAKHIMLGFNDQVGAS